MKFSDFSGGSMERPALRKESQSFALTTSGARKADCTPLRQATEKSGYSKRLEITPVRGAPAHFWTRCGDPALSNSQGAQHYGAAA
jgi:hypothetical protein